MLEASIVKNIKFVMDCVRSLFIENRPFRKKDSSNAAIRERFRLMPATTGKLFDDDYRSEGLGRNTVDETQYRTEGLFREKYRMGYPQTQLLWKL